jgi:hypothetical protein
MRKLVDQIDSEKDLGKKKTLTQKFEESVPAYEAMKKQYDIK